jgi:hypothetical protein
LTRTGGRARRGCVIAPPAAHPPAHRSLRPLPRPAERGGGKLRLDQQTAALILRATGAAELDPAVLVGLLVTGLEQANLAPVLAAKWRQRGEAVLGPKAP